jgi:hypothetical protein
MKELPKVLARRRPPRLSRVATVPLVKSDNQGQVTRSVGLLALLAVVLAGCFGGGKAASQAAGSSSWA